MALGIYEGVASDDGIKNVQVFLAGVVQDIDGTCGQIWIHDEEGQGADEHHWDGHMSQGSLHYFFVVEIAEHEEARYDPEDCYAICHKALNQATAEFCIIGICGTDCPRYGHRLQSGRQRSGPVRRRNLYLMYKLICSLGFLHILLPAWLGIFSYWGTGILPVRHTLPYSQDQQFLPVNCAQSKQNYVII